jgi:hypothetical protein
MSCNAVNENNVEGRKIFVYSFFQFSNGKNCGEANQE